MQAGGVNLMSLSSKDTKIKVLSDNKVHELTYTLPLKRFNVGDLRLVAELVDSDSDSNVATYGYNDEMLLKITSADVQSSGILDNDGKLSE